MNLTDHPISLAIIGRPNVGKSTLFNRMTGKRRAIVYDEPGVTRDWQSHVCTFQGLLLNIYDTPGLECSLQELPQDLIAGFLWVVDSSTLLMPADLKIAGWLHKQNKPTIVVANKCETEESAQQAWIEASRLGFPLFVAISALHGQGMHNLANAISTCTIESLSQREPLQELASPHIPCVTILGRPNAGKSSLANCLLGYERMRVGPMAGLTRDAIKTLAQWKEKAFYLVDTAGIKRHIHQPLDHLSYEKAYRALVFSHVAIVVIDALQDICKQDLILMDKVQKEGRALIVALNKWDQVSSPGDYLQHIKNWASRYTVIPISCRTQYNIPLLMETVFSCYEKWTLRLSTGQLNRWLAQHTSAHQPPRLGSKRIKIKYITQIKGRPPTFVLFGRDVENLPKSYCRYLENALIRSFAFSHVKLICHNMDSMKNSP